MPSVTGAAGAGARVAGEGDPLALGVLALGVVALAGAFLAVGLGQLAQRSLGPRWQRTNFRGSTVSLGEGVAVAAALAGLASIVALYAQGGRRVGLAVLLCAVVAAAVGMVDDHARDGASKGLGGHLRALARGRVTTGTVKLVALPVLGIVVALVLHPSAGAPTVLRDACLVAGAANLANLLDLRPGRALKAVLVVVVAMVDAGRAGAAALAAGVAGVCAGALPADLGERGMLGDTGANALGAVVGAVAVSCLGGTARTVSLVAVAGLTLLSERVSFSRVVDAVAPLRVVDRWGRRP